MRKKLSTVLLLSFFILISFIITRKYINAEEQFIYIETKEDLKNIKNNLEGYYELKNDIDLENELWEEIGVSTASFVGTLDGKGYKIKNLKIDSTTNTGLFREIKGAEIKNLIIENVDIKTTKGAGTIAYKASSSSKITNCAVIGEGEIKSGSTYAGGIVSYLDNSFIEKSYTTIKISSTGTYAAGIAGYVIKSEINDAFSLSTVTGNDTSGGIIGYGSYSTIKNSYFAGKLYLKTIYQQRLVGNNSTSTVINSYFDLTISPAGKYLENEQAKTTEQLRDQLTYEGWDFENIWIFTENFLYPTLKSIDENIEEKLGTKTNPYLIRTREDLSKIKQDLEGYYELKNDIDLENELWEEIGVSTASFVGTLDGKGYKIKNLKIDSTTNTGLFGEIKGAEIKNLIIENVDIKTTKGAGTIAYKASSSSKITNCAVIGEGEIKSGSTYAGGIVSYLDNSFIEKSYTTIKISSTGTYAAGIAGYVIKSEINDAFSLSTVTGNDTSGGIIGYGSYSTIKNSYFAGKLYLKTIYQQRLVGNNSTSTVINSYFDLTISPAGKYLENEQAKTTEQLRDQLTYEGWDFENIWIFTENFLYPTLKSIDENIEEKLGTKTNPYLIRTREDLSKIKQDLEGYYELKNDIDLENELWEEIGVSTASFVGTLDGKGYKIKNLKIDSTTNTGLFGEIKGAEIKNLIIENVDIKTTKGAGTIAYKASSSSKITNCAVIGEGEIKSGSTYAGGIVSYLDNSFIEKSYTTIKISSTGTYAAGIAGYVIKSEINDAFSLSTVTGNDTSGGIIGYGSYSTIKNSYFAGKLYLKTIYQQRLVGNNSTSTVINSYFDLTISPAGKYLENEQAKTTEQLRDQLTYEGWDFENIWIFTENFLYPTLKSIDENIEEKLGTKTNPYLIRTREDLSKIKQDLEGYYELKNDIDLENELWEEIGVSTASFVGTLDGKGYKIKNLKIDSTTNTGLFGEIKGAEIKNLIIENVDIKTTKGAGTIAYKASSSSKITNCAVIGEGEIKSGSTYAGGIVSYLDNSFIEKSYTTIKISSAGTYAAGIAGYVIKSEINDAFSLSTVTGNDTSGGIIGYGSYSTIKNSYFAGKLYLKTIYQQRLVGNNSTSTVINSYFDLTISPAGKYLENEQAKTTEQLRDQLTYEGWDFENIWIFTENFLYPTLKSIDENIEEKLGTKTNPYLIRTREDLSKIKQDLEGYYELKNDIDLENELWEEIGVSTASFVGTLDGKGYKIKNLKIDSTTNTGLFGEIKGAEIKNLIIENVDIKTTKGAGTIAYKASSSSKITNCAVIGEGEIKSGSTYAGGIVSYLDNSFIEKSYTTIKISSAGTYAAGIAGYVIKSEINDAFSLSTVTGKSTNTGGITGYTTNTTIKNSYYSGKIFINSQLKTNLTGNLSTSNKIINTYFNLSLVPEGNYIISEQSKTTEELQNKSTFVDWDFINIWNFEQGFLPMIKITATNQNNNSLIPKNGIINYKYDNLNRLIEINYINGVMIKYNYDSAGNLTEAKIYK